MLFQEALSELKDGIAMRRAEWPIEEGYLKLMPGMKFVWKIVLVPNPNAGNFIFSVEDLEGNDWEEFVSFEEIEGYKVIEAEKQAD
jgi:hypothetical protein